MDGLCSERFRSAHCGYYVIEADTGREVCQHNADFFFIPASLQKLLISAAALHLLGENFCFHTDLEYEGHIDKEGTLHGNVWIRGGGDPTFSLDTLFAWANELKHHGIRSIKGKILADASYFETQRASSYWSFEDLGNYYGAGACGLSINQNLYKVTFKPGEKEGAPATVVCMDPHIPYLTLNNEVATGPSGSGDQVWVFGSEYSPIQFFRGTVPLDEKHFTIKASIPDPAAFCAHAFSEKVKPLDGYDVVRLPASSPTIKIARHVSAPLRTLLYVLNKHSNNLIAEHLLKAMGEGKAERGCQQVANFLHGLGIEAHVKDGAGLARTNLITPKGLVKLLHFLLRSQNHIFLTSLPQPREEGSLQKFPLEKGTLKAKTGSMHRIGNLAGYFTKSKTYIFALFCNHYGGDPNFPAKEISHFLASLD